MSASPFISICIPAYKRVAYIKRLLDSIVSQSFPDFEVIITDDSNDASVKQLAEEYTSKFPLLYHANEPALGSPANWNKAISLARGQWIKIMHDDDWFGDRNALQVFAETALQNPGVDFIFSGVTEVMIDTRATKEYVPGRMAIGWLRRSPLYLLKRNFIGHPSTTLIRNNRSDWYDEKIKWVVDIEFYIRYLLEHPAFVNIPLPLINIGISEYQITREVFRRPEVEIPEHLYLYQKLPQKSLRNIVAYDYYWRLWRNLSVRSEEDVARYNDQGTLPPVLRRMIRWQSHWPPALLRVGPFSKLLMIFSYWVNRHSI